MVQGIFPGQTQVIIKPGATGACLGIELLKSVLLIFSDIFYFDRGDGGRNLVTRSEDRIEHLN